MTDPFRPQHFVQYGLWLLISSGLLACGGGGGSDGTTTATLPGMPIVGTVSPGNASASLSFSAPSSNGGASITDYTAICVAGSLRVSATATASPVVVTGLTNGMSYSCSLSATNSVGVGTSSAAVTVTPSAGAVATGTEGVLCSVLNSGMQALSYNNTVPGGLATQVNDNLAFNYSWTCDISSRNLV